MRKDLKLGLTVTAAGVAAVAFAKCMPATRQVVHSANARYTLVLDPRGPYKIVENGSAGKKVLSASTFKPLGHHYAPALSEDGSLFVLVDQWAGIQVYTRTGKQIFKLLPEHVLSPRELQNREAKWTCHQEGMWLRSYRVDDRGARLVLSGGRTHTISW
ncbi:MAG TPA: hypothetical protein VEX38_04185 [Fimbriimonadaceae bacterium]|nr:hypothetical protein [Fimbriimonadaceae bacterium]